MCCSGQLDSTLLVWEAGLSESWQNNQDQQNKPKKPEPVSGDRDVSSSVLPERFCQEEGFQGWVMISLRPGEELKAERFNFLCPSRVESSGWAGGESLRCNRLQVAASFSRHSFQRYKVWRERPAVSPWQQAAGVGYRLPEMTVIRTEVILEHLFHITGVMWSPAECYYWQKYRRRQQEVVFLTAGFSFVFSDIVHQAPPELTASQFIKSCWIHYQLQFPQNPSRRGLSLLNEMLTSLMDELWTYFMFRYVAAINFNDLSCEQVYSCVIFISCPI